MVCKFEAGKQLKVYMAEFFIYLTKCYCCSCMKFEKKFPINYFSSLYLRDIKALNFTSDWVKKRTRWENGDSRAVTLIQERLVLQFLCSTVVSF